MLPAIVIFTEEIKDALAELVADNLMLHIGNEYLALPVDRRAGKT